MSLPDQEERAFLMLIRELGDLERAGTYTELAWHARRCAIMSLPVLAASLWWLGVSCWWPLTIGGAVAAVASAAAAINYLRVVGLRRSVRLRDRRPRVIQQPPEKRSR